jgi:putative Mg2+ transporter-C (MgtC) family protein
MDLDTDTLVRLGAAVIFGGLIGFNRDIYGKPTGIRAHALVALGAAILVVAVHDQADAASRVIQGVIAGIGFLGGGVILRGTRTLHVYHLVTAATLWVTTGIGILCGLGAWKLAAATTGIVLIVLIVGVHLDKWLYGRGGVKADDREP